MFSPASSKASFAAATAYCEKSSILFAALKSMRSFATNPFTSAAICTLNSDASNFVIGPIPTLPSLIPAQNSSTVFPIGVTAPSPVTTTLLFIKQILSKAGFPPRFIHHSYQLLCENPLPESDLLVSSQLHSFPEDSVFCAIRQYPDRLQKTGLTLPFRRLH